MSRFTRRVQRATQQRSGPLPSPREIAERLAAVEQAQELVLADLGRMRVRTSDAHLEEHAHRAVSARLTEVDRLRDDAVAILEALVRAGAVTREQLAAAVAEGGS